MKIGIMTYWTSEENYGQILQGYALQQVLRNMGHEPFLIRYDYRYEPGQMSFNRPEHFHTRHFEDFRQKYMVVSDKEYMSYHELVSAPPKADSYIVGSDQVWYLGLNPENKLNRLHAYFLDFGGEDIQRYAVAASWGGVWELSPKLKDEIKPLLARFKKVTVREESGIEFCKQCGRDDAEVFDDPTVLLGVETYRDIYRREKIKGFDKPYVLLYYINQGDDFDAAPIYDRAKKEGLKVIYVPVGVVDDRFEKKYPTVEEWLCLVDHAEYIITNSFHCVLFSIFFNKLFYAIKLRGYSAGMNIRLENIFGRYGIPDNRFIQF